MDHHTLNNFQLFYQVTLTEKEFMQISSSLWGGATALHAGIVELR